MRGTAWMAGALTGLACAGSLAAPPARAECGAQDLGTALVRAAGPGGILTLDDGRQVLPAALDLPPGGERPAAEKFLAAQYVGRSVRLRGEAAPDRYGRLRAFVFAAGKDLEGSLQQAMVAHGLARVAAPAGDRACATDLLARERGAREAGLGLWTEPGNAVQRADDPGAVRALRGRFAVVEGRVLSVRDSGGTVYVNFGRRWSEDFTVTVAKRDERRLAADGLDLRALARQTVRVRGFVEERGGPWIAVTRPEQIELVRN